MATHASPGKDLTGTSPVSSHTPEQLLLRYARGRVAHFLPRQIVGMVGSLMLTAVSNWQIGGLAALLALLGEIVDCGYLRTLPRRLEQGESLQKVSMISALTGMFQAMTIAAGALLSWFATAHHTLLFTMAFVAAATINSGLIYPFHRKAAVFRLGIYLATTMAIVIAILATSDFRAPELYLDLAGIAMMTYMIASCLEYVVKESARSRRNLSERTKQGLALERAYADLKDSKRETEQLSLVARHANDGVILCNAKREVLWVNETFTRLTGYTLEDAHGKRPAAVLTCEKTDPRVLHEMAETIQSGQPFRGHVAIRTKDGRDAWVESNQVPVFDESGNLEKIVMVERDVTEQKEVARKLAAAKREAEKAVRAKAEFLATMSHEIRTPMNGIIGMSDLICETELNEEQQLYANTIRSSATSLLHLINDILDFSKLDASKMTLDRVDYDLRACLEDTVLPFRTQAMERRLWLVLDIAEDVPQFIHGDDKRLRQVLVNLIGNALKFTEAGGVKICLSVSEAHCACPPDTTGAKLNISVRDTGIGINARQLDFIFQEFSQAESDTTRRFGGTGLGLAISRKLVEAMEGEISVSSKIDEGSCFCVHLPLVPAKRPMATPETKPDTFCLKGKTLLLAEDNATNQILIQKYLRDTGTTLVIARNGVEAVELAREHRPDLILMDMSMPLKSGIEATQDIRGGPGPQPVIVALTANTVARDRDRCLEAGMNGFLTKPIRRSELLQALVTHLAPDTVIPFRASG